MMPIRISESPGAAIQNRRMAELGLPHFETLSDATERNALMIARLRAHGLEEQAQKVSICRGDWCASSICLEGCNIASRRRRCDTIESSLRILQRHGGPLYQVTIVHPNWEMAEGNLAELNLLAMRQWNARRLNATGIKRILAVGICEVSLNRELSGSVHWAGEIQQIVAGVPREELKQAFFLSSRDHARVNQSPVMVSEVDNLPVQLGYAQKHYVVERRAYISPKTSRQARRKLPPQPAHWAEHDAWLLGLPLGARTIAYGCGRRGQTLFEKA